MKVITISVDSNKLDDTYKDSSFSDNALNLIELGAEYIILAIEIRMTGMYYYGYWEGSQVTSMPAPFFKLVDNKIPDDWIIAPFYLWDKNGYALSFPEWFGDHFLEDFYDDKGDTKRIVESKFKQYYFTK